MQKEQEKEKDTLKVINELLSSLNLKELISLQYEIIQRIELKIDHLTDRSNEEIRNIDIVDIESPNDHLSSSLDNRYQQIRHNDIKKEARESLEIWDDSQDLVLTQYNTNSNTNTPYGSSQLNTQIEEPIFIKENGSSPLKESLDMNLTNIIRSRRTNNKNTYHVNNKNNNNNKVKSNTITNRAMEDSQNLNVKIKSEPIIPSKTNQYPSEKLNFNINPITKKPWILEDFKPNNQTMDVKRGRQKLEQFYSKVGKPVQLYLNEHGSHHANTGNLNELNRDNSEYLFDNLRHRSKSPPGYGRMDFPSTQERKEDKRKSQKIIYEKTLYRFYAATNYMIPPFEREFLFKKDLLNRIVDDNNFTWNETNLKIFPRSK